MFTVQPFLNEHLSKNEAVWPYLDHHYLFVYTAFILQNKKFLVLIFKYCPQFFLFTDKTEMGICHSFYSLTFTLCVINN